MTKKPTKKPQFLAGLDPQLGGMITIPAGQTLWILEGVVSAIYRLWNVGGKGGTFTVSHNIGSRTLPTYDALVVPPGQSLDVSGIMISVAAVGADQMCYYQFISLG